MRPKGHPIQPVQMGEDGIIRFKENSIVVALLGFASSHGLGLNAIAAHGYPQDDYSQLMQLIGYSVSGYGDLSQCNPAHVKKADRLADQIIQKLIKDSAE